ncbi:hypothetical protein [Campylobacter curvus]|uniref:hypothetical protein n=1 Tax=Campylobacter curvus TaxID=200 RepID=UPI0014702BD2|nr:hypothetical protein [Campylobacter curvus]
MVHEAKFLRVNFKTFTNTKARYFDFRRGGCEQNEGAYKYVCDRSCESNQRSTAKRHEILQAAPKQTAKYREMD